MDEKSPESRTFFQRGARLQVLCLTQRLPFPPNRGDRILAYHLLRHMRAYADVQVVSLVHSTEEAQAAARLDDLTTGVHVYRVARIANLVRATAALPGRRPLTHLLLDAPGIRTGLRDIARRSPPDVVVAFGTGMAQFAVEPPLDRIPLVLHMVDVDSAKWAALAERTRPPLRWVYRREAGRLSEFEVTAAERADATVLVAARERDLLARAAPGARIHVMPNGIDIGYFTPPDLRERAPDVVFCGVMDYAPNVEAVVWFARHVWPAIRDRYPAAQFKVVGLNPTTMVRELATEPGIVVTGAVADVRPYLWSASVSIAPLFVARGIQNKVMEAVASGLPAVITTAVAEGLPNSVVSACRIADTTDFFAKAVLELIALPVHEREALLRRADLSSLTWERALAPFKSLLEAASHRQRVE